MQFRGKRWLNGEVIGASHSCGRANFNNAQFGCRKQSSAAINCQDYGPTASIEVFNNA
jgi:hypothetical protein